MVYYTCVNSKGNKFNYTTFSVISTQCYQSPLSVRNASKYLCSLNPAHLERLCFPGSNDGEMNPILNFVSSLHFVYYHNQHGIDRGETFQYTRGAEQNFWNRAYYFCKKSPLPQKPPPVTNSFIFSSLIKWAQIQGSLCLTFNTPCTQLCVVVDIFLCHAVSEVNCLRMLVKIEVTQWRTICSCGWQRKRTFLESDHPSGCKGDCWNTGSFSGQNGFYRVGSLRNMRSRTERLFHNLA